VLDFVLSRLRRSHCRSTIQAIAIDALRHVSTPAGRRLVSWMTFNHRLFLRGVNDPDRRFRDFQNHVIHVTDGYWGGAPRVAHRWYDRLLNSLVDGQMSDAAHAAGVLCHYISDPLTPLHTEHCQHACVLHRPIEYAINLAYDDLYRLWNDDPQHALTDLPNSRVWLGEMILRGSARANQHYWTFLSDIDLEQVMSRPRDCFGNRFASSAAEMLGRSVTAIARTLERAAQECEDRTGQTLQASDMSRPWVRDLVRMMPNRVGLHIWKRKQSEKMQQLLDEYHKRGELVEHLPSEVAIVQHVIEIYHRERQWTERHGQRTLRQAIDDRNVIAGRIGIDIATVAMQNRRPETA
jgi:histone H3/H4